MTPEGARQLAGKRLKPIHDCRSAIAFGAGNQLLVSIFQAATQINEMTLSFISYWSCFW